MKTKRDQEGGFLYYKKLKLYWRIRKHNEKDHYRCENWKAVVFIWAHLFVRKDIYGTFLQRHNWKEKQSLYLLDFHGGVISWSSVFSKCYSSVKCPPPLSKEFSLLINPMT